MERRDIKDFTLDELKREMTENLKAPLYRAGQIFSWLYQRGVTSFDDMTNLPKKLREKLAHTYFISSFEPAEHLKSSDKTEKLLFKLIDGNYIETVLLYAKKRKTICISTQVGCKFACPFCASGSKGFVRNLTRSEIANQILFLKYMKHHNITNIVVMGMGEPLDNFLNVSKAIEIITCPQGMGISARRITLSTCGLIPGIDELKDSRLGINLSISLHATNNKLRNKIIPINKKYPLEQLFKSCEEFIQTTKRKLTFEYILIKGINDSLQDADELASIAKRLNAKINLIPYSSIKNSDLKAPTYTKVDIFAKRIAIKKVNITLRESRGKDIDAACGQLAGKIDK